jgi:PAS domain S-box-containing protein
MPTDSEPGIDNAGGPRAGLTPGRVKGGAGRLSDEFVLLHETAPMGYFILERDTTITNANISGARIFGRSPGELRGARFTDLLSGPDLDCFQRFLKNIMAGDSWCECETTVHKPDGSHLFAVLQGRRLVQAEEIVLFVTDITKRRNAEVALKESEQKYKDVADRLAEGVFEADAAGRVTYANLKVMSSLGLSEDDLKRGLKVFDMIAPSSLALARERFDKVLEQQDMGAGEYTLLRRDGSSFQALVHSLAVVREGQVVGVRGILIDISERKRAETALEESEKKFRELSELLGAGIFEADASGVLTYANPHGLGMFGLGEADLRDGFNIFDVIMPQDQGVAAANYGRVLGHEDFGPVEYLVKKKDGTVFTILTHSTPIIREGQVAGVRGIVVDISDLKRTEQALRESERRFRTLLKSLHEGIWVLDKDDRTTFVNPRMTEMLGYTEEEMLGKPVYDFNDEEWKKFTVAKMERRRQGVTEQLEGELLRKDGGRVYALFETSPILDEDGNYAGSIAGVQDITDRKRNEERMKRTLAELDRSNKELEHFAYVTSHDLREPLRMMTSFSQALEKHYKGRLDGSADEYIHFIVDGASRMQRLIDDILVYSRVGTRGLPFEPVDMGKALQEALLNLKASVDETRARITSDPLPVIRGDLVQMQQLLQNLLGNAVKFHKDGEPPVVRISADRKGEDWLFSVQDNGIGMDPELFGRLFVLFQRLHPPDKYPGTGVGLAVAKKIVERHGGRIWVESQPEKGSTFHFTIPAAPKAGQDERG